MKKIKFNKKYFAVFALFIIFGVIVFVLTRNPIKLNKKVYLAGEKVKASVNMDIRSANVFVLGPDNNKIDAQIDKNTTDGNSTITIAPPRSFQPGEYTLEITQADGTKLTQNFMWGVLALNTNKSIYAPNENAYIAYAVLDEEGKMVCNAEVELKVRNDNLGIYDTLSTKNGKIKINPECSKKALVEKDDFESNYKLAGEGTYSLHLTAKTKNGTYSIDDQVVVKNDSPFSVERTSRTRIYPVHNYDMLLTVRANQDFNGAVIENIPQEFVVSQFATATTPFTENYSSTEADTKLLEWKINIKKGDTVYLGYKYDSPDKSPWFFTTGPLTFKSGSKNVFKENRRWQIAVDDVAPVMYWKLNEGTGSTANDSTTNINSGTISGATWTEENLCLQGKCLSFDGSNDNVSRADDADLDFGAGGSFTLEAWIKHPTQSSGQDILISKFNEAGYKLIMESDGDITCGIDYDSAWTPTDSVTSTAASYDDSKWHHVACVKDANSSLTLYIDGVSVGTPDTSLTNSTLANTDPIYVGIDADGTSNAWLGFIDDVKVFNYARTASQVVSDFNSRGGSKGTSSVLGLNTQNSLSHGLVGYWKFDESSGNTTDYSGNAATLTNTGATTFTTGKFGNGADLESGNSQYFTVSDTAPLSVTGDMTISGWIKPESITASTQFDIVSKWNTTDKSYLLAQYGDEIRLYLNSASNYVETSSTNLSTGTWYLVTAVYYANNQSVKIYVNGVEQPTTTTGTIPSSITDTTASFSIGSEVSAGSSTLNLQVDASANDAYQVVMSPLGKSPTAGGLVYTSTQSGSCNGSLICITAGRGSTSTDNFSLGARFTNVTIPQGATINSATFTLTSTDTYSTANPIDYIVSLQAADNPGAFTTVGDNDLESGVRTRTTADSGAWDVNSLTADTEYSISVTSAVQEVINRSGWASGNAMVVLADTHTTTTANNEWQNWYSYDESAAKAPKLSINYDTNTGSNFYDGVVDDVRVYSRTLTTSEVSNLYSNFSPVPVAYWNFEEGTGTSAYDKSGNGITGTLTNGPYWGTGKFGKGVNFDGSNDHILVADLDTLDFAAGASFTVSAWIKHTTQSSGQDFIISKFASTGYKLYMEADGDITFGIDDDGTSFPEDSVTSTAATYDDNKWHYVVGVKDSNNSLRLYIDGVEVGTADTSISATGTLANADPFYIGIDEDGTSNAWLGEIDEVKIYNYARTPSQIIQDMNGGHPLGGSPVGSALGYWKLDEGTNNTCAGGTNDACNSGSGGSTHDGAGTGITWTNEGKFNRAVSFNGSTSNISISNASLLPKLDSAQSITGWFYYTSVPSSVQQIFSTGNAGGTGISIGSRGTGNFDVWKYGGTILVNTTAPTANAWHHYAYTFDGSTHKLYLDGVLKATSTVTPNTGAPAGAYIGSWVDGSSEFYSGKIDEVKIYGAVLSTNEVIIDYNAGKSIALGALGTDSSGNPSNAAERTYCPPGDNTTSCAPVAHYDFEEKTGNTIFDKTDTANNGTLVGTGTWTQGKYGGGFEFNGSNGNYFSVDDETSIQPSGNAITVQAWVYRPNTTNTAGAAIVCKGNGGGGESFCLDFPNTNDLTVRFFVSTTLGTRSAQTGPITAGKWTLVTGIFPGDGSTIKIATNASISATGAGSGTLDENDNGHVMSIGCRQSGSTTYDMCLNGIVDDIRIYDYARSREQMVWDFAQGAPAVHYKFDECSGTSINDSMQRLTTAGTLTVGSSGTQTSAGNCNTTSTAWGNGASGKRNYSLNFDGTDDSANLGSPGLLANKGAFSWAFWVKPGTLGTQDCIICAFNSDTTGTQFGFETGTSDSSVLRTYISSSTTDLSNYGETPSGVLQNGVWTHVVVSFDGTQSTNATKLKVYINGKQQTLSFTGTIPTGLSSGGTITLGATSNGARYFNGQIDDLRYFSSSLTEIQAKSIMNDGAVRWGPNTGAP